MLENTTGEAKDRVTLKIKGAHEAELDVVDHQPQGHEHERDQEQLQALHQDFKNTSTSKPRSRNKRCDSKTKCSLSAAARHVYNHKHPAHSRRQ